MMRKNHLQAIFLILTALVAGCFGGAKRQIPTEAGASASDSIKVFDFARTPTFTVTSEMMAIQFDKDDLPSSQGAMDSITTWKSLYNLLLDTLLRDSARSLNLEKEDSLLFRQQEQLCDDRLMRLLYQRVVLDSIIVSDSAISASYEETKDSYKVGDQYRARHIVIHGDNLKRSADSALYQNLSVEQLDSVALAKITALLERVKKGDSFDTLAMMYSQDPGSASRGGDLGYFPLASMVKPFDSLIQNTPVGSLGGPVKTRFGWHIARVEEFAPEHYLPLDSVRPQITNAITQKQAMDRGKRYVDSLTAIGKIAFDSAALAIPDSLQGEGALLAVVNPEDTQFCHDSILFRQYVVRVRPFMRQKQIDRELTIDEKKELISALAIRSYLLCSARHLGYDRDSEYVAFESGIRDQYTISTLRKRILNDGYQPSEVEIRAYYDSHTSDYQVERPVYVQHIIFADSNMAEYVRDLLSSGADFMEMVDQYYPGDPEIKRSAADLGFIGPVDMPAAFWTAANYMPVGQISYPIKTEYGYHLIKVLEKKYATDFENAKFTIAPILAERRRQEVLRAAVESRLSAPPVIFWDRLNDLYRTPVKPLDTSYLNLNP